GDVRMNQRRIAREHGRARPGLEIHAWQEGSDELIEGVRGSSLDVGTAPLMNLLEARAFALRRLKLGALLARGLEEVSPCVIGTKAHERTPRARRRSRKRPAAFRSAASSLTSASSIRKTNSSPFSIRSSRAAM